MIGDEVLWTDKSNLFALKRRTFVTCRTNEKILEEYLMPSVKHGGNMMVWECFRAGCGEYQVKAIINREGYYSISQCYAIPCGWHLIGASVILQEDNGPKNC